LLAAQVLFSYDGLEKFGRSNKVEVLVPLVLRISRVQAVALVVRVAHNRCEPVAAQTPEEKQRDENLTVL
jgi:hypothetical protein